MVDEIFYVRRNCGKQMQRLRGSFSSGSEWAAFTSSMLVEISDFHEFLRKVVQFVLLHFSKAYARTYIFDFLLQE